MRGSVATGDGYGAWSKTFFILILTPLSTNFVISAKSFNLSLLRFPQPLNAMGGLHDTTYGKPVQWLVP